MKERNNAMITVLENFVLLMILLVLIQTFLEDLSIYMGWNINTVNKIKLSAFIFDAFFTLEFLIRMTVSASKKKGTDYFFYKNGWIDLLASVPLLLLISGPEFMAQIFNFNIMKTGFIGALGTVKVIKAIRVARILRLLRVLKIFGKIKNVDSVMAQRHISSVSTIVISSMIIFLISVSFLEEFSVIPSKYAETVKSEKSINGALKDILSSGEAKGPDAVKNMKDAARAFPSHFGSVALIETGGEVIYRSPHVFDEYFLFFKAHPDRDIVKTYDLGAENGPAVTYYRHDYLTVLALANLVHFILIVFILICLIVIYTRHFALTVSDPIFVMRNGFEKKDYTYAVKIQKYYKDDDIFVLAEDFNTRWLPAKMRKLSETKSQRSSISFDDVFKSSDGK